MKLHFLKTRWSDIIILEKNGRVAFVDTGFDEQFGQIDEYLGKMGIKKIDFILLTHFHRDHYGCIPKLVENYTVDMVYMKEYSGLDSTTAWGSAADDAYRADEKAKYENMCRLIREKSTLCMLDTVKKIDFEGCKLLLYQTENSIGRIYEDESVAGAYHRILFSENQNSLAVFFEENGKTVFLGGDLMDYPSEHPDANYVSTQIARKIGREIDIYKAPHHGTVHTAGEEALEIYKPKLAVITNEDDYLKNSSDVYSNLKKANPNVEILITNDNDVVLEV